MSFTKSNGWMTAALLLALGAVTNAYAQQPSQNPGIVRISDGRVRTSNGQVTQTGAFGHHGGPLYAAPPQMPNGSCPTGNCPTGNCPTGHCPTGNCPQCHGHCLFCEHYCKHSPDYGYSPPSKYPLYRRGVEYTSYYPAQWYGAGADYSQSRAPMVYMPTDTTQLGFYYQHVPFWQPMPNRLPERPIPAQWHITPPAVQASRFCYGCFGGNVGPYYGGHGHWGHGQGYCPPVYNTTPMQTTPTPATNPGDVVPPTQSAPAPVDSAPQPIDSGSPGALPAEADYDPALPPAPGGLEIPSRTLPTDSAASNHIKRL